MSKVVSAEIFDKSKMTRTEVDGVVSFKYDDEKAYVNGTDIDEATLKKVADYNIKYTEAAAQLTANIADEDMSKHKKVERVMVNFPYSMSKRGAIDVTVDRSKTYPAIGGGEPVTKSAMRVIVTDPFVKPSKNWIKELEKDLTKSLLS